MIQGRYANIIVDISHEKVDRIFQYRIPDALAEIMESGMCVSIPFGAGNHIKQGYVMEITDKPQFPPEKMKLIEAIVAGSISVEADAIRLAAWMKKTYGSTMIAALKTVLPVKQAMKAKEKKKITRLICKEETIAMLGESMRKHQPAKVRILTELSQEAVLPYELVTGKLNISAATLRSLESQGVIAIEAENCYRNPVTLDTERDQGKCLSDEQSAIRDKITKDYRAGIYKTYLIHGITGSGKTEVYLALIEQVIALKRQCIVLIPEIALTYQTLLRFYKRFGDRVSVMNSTLSPGEKFDQCERAKKGEIDIIIGPRSALFVPFPNLGMIIMDEEHETSYKSESMPKYHARETAQYLAQMKGASLVLGSATPSLEAYYRAKNGMYELVTLNRRLTGGALPTVYTIDLREELKRGNRSIFSSKLQELMHDRMHKKEQIILFLNRRGYAGFISCRSCGHVMKCPHCDVSLSQHMGGKLLCHYCGYEIPDVKKCPSCGSAYISGFKAGTQQIEQQVHRLLPEARVLRMDGDTTKAKGSYEKILSSFAEQKADILIGTQMIVKGHDFPDVTLVGILAADLSLNDNDYRAGERTFQLLTQAAGRAGRGSKPGEVVIQTYRPDHYSIVCASEQNYEAFYEEEILFREWMSYPPSAHMLAVQIVSLEENRGKQLAVDIASLLIADYSHADQNEIKVIGPSQASISKINDRYRFIIYVKHKQYNALISAKDRIEEFLEKNKGIKESVLFDFNPMDGY